MHDLDFMTSIMEARELIDDAEDAYSLEQLLERNNGEFRLLDLFRFDFYIQKWK